MEKHELDISVANSFEKFFCRREKEMSWEPKEKVRVFSLSDRELVSPV